ncbi:MAG: hypothetical protein K6T91_04600 [Firmicutes bacterium]|nr:hypothetical protein [Bacillota bacterium]
MAIEVIMPGSCGELVQGIIGGVNFHITCPIKWYSRATVSLIKDKIIEITDGCTKTAEATRQAIEIIKPECGVKVDIKSKLAKGKGMASSTADISAALVGTFKLFERNITPRELARIAVSVEPTDGIFLEGIAVFDHVEGKMLQLLGNAPPIEIVVLEPPETVDTVDFNRKKKTGLVKDDPYIKEAFEMAVDGLRSANNRLIGEAATLSALLNQSILYKPELKDIIDVCKRRGGLGVNVAHSGTVIGILVDKGYGKRLFDKISHYIPKLWDAYVVEMTNGGPNVTETYPEWKSREVLA